MFHHVFLTPNRRGEHTDCLSDCLSTQSSMYQTYSKIFGDEVLLISSSQFWLLFTPVSSSYGLSIRWPCGHCSSTLGGNSTQPQAPQTRGTLAYSCSPAAANTLVGRLVPGPDFPTKELKPPKKWWFYTAHVACKHPPSITYGYDLYRCFSFLKHYE